MPQGDPDWQETNPEWFNTWTVSRSFPVWGVWTSPLIILLWQASQWPPPHASGVLSFTR